MFHYLNGTMEFTHCPSSCRSSFPINNLSSMINHIHCEEQESVQPPIDLEDGDKILLIDMNPAMEIHARTNIATELVIKDQRKKEAKPWNEQVPEYLHDFEDVFTKEKYDDLPPHRPWDHAIELLPGSQERLDCKIYPLSLEEQKQLDKFLEEHLRTGRIRHSKSPMASSLFFVRKKDGSLRMV